jgi:hypothetical protein
VTSATQAIKTKELHFRIAPHTRRTLLLLALPIADVKQRASHAFLKYWLKSYKSISYSVRRSDGTKRRMVKAST